MRRWKPIIVFLALFAVAGCATSNDAVKAGMCDSWSVVLNELAVKRSAGKLSADQIRTVDVARPVVRGICMDAAASTPMDLDQLRDALARARRINGER